jgi:lyso-ornithine lipid O-acyltransferase
VLAAVRIAALLLWLAFCVPLHLVARAAGSQAWPRRFLRGVIWIIGVRVKVTGSPLGPHTLAIANHSSWVDIPVLGAATGCAFVSKDELKGHPVMHWLCEQNGTVFVDRSDRRAIGEQTAEMLWALQRQQPLTLFPEGTVGNGGRLLPFRPSLLNAFAPPPDGVTVRSVAIDYGSAAPDLGWPSGESGKANFLRMVGRPGTVQVIIKLLPPLPAFADRKRLARAAHDAIADALAPSGIAPAAV